MLLTLVSSEETDGKRDLRVPARPDRCHRHCGRSPSPGPVPSPRNRAGPGGGFPESAAVSRRLRRQEEKPLWPLTTPASTIAFALAKSCSSGATEPSTG